MLVLSAVPTGNFKRLLANCTVERKGTTIYFNKTGVKFQLTLPDNGLLIQICKDLLIDFTYMQPYYASNPSQETVQSASDDKYMLAQLTTACALFFYKHLNTKNVVSCHHPKHDPDCTRNKTQTPCYQLAQRAVKLVNEETLSKIMVANGFKPIQVTMADIIGNDMHNITQDVHFDCHYLLSFLWVYNARLKPPTPPSEQPSAAPEPSAEEPSAEPLTPEQSAPPPEPLGPPPSPEPSAETAPYQPEKPAIETPSAELESAEPISSAKLPKPTESA